MPTTSNAILTSHGFPDNTSGNALLVSHGDPYTSGTDTTPNAFTFTDQTGVATSTTITSAPITVTGINATATVTITGGTYQINGTGSFVSTSGTVNNLDTITVRHTSSASNSTATNTVLTVGGVSDTFTSTTVAASGSTLTHGAEFTITGSGFGTKVANGVTVNTPRFFWSGNNTDPTFDWIQGESMSRQATGWRASTPNARISHYLVGKRSDGDYQDWDMVRSVDFPVTTQPVEVYASFLVRLDSSWDDSTHEAGLFDHQMKPCSMQWHGADYMDSPYLYHGVPYVESTGNTAGEWVWGQNGIAITNTSGGVNAANPRAGWVRVEYIASHSASGFVRVFETTSINSLGRRSVLVADGDTRFSGGALPSDSTAAFHFGGYVRDYDTGNNWIYHTNMFLDVGSTTRVVLTDTNDLVTATMIEPQPYTAWGASSITIVGNCGGLASSSTGYLWVLTGANTVVQGPTAVTIA
jgi:hypothetical protein